MKKLKTNWSIKKNDITRSLSRIKKTNRPALDMTFAPEGRKKLTYFKDLIYRMVKVK